MWCHSNERKCDQLSSQDIYEELFTFSGELYYYERERMENDSEEIPTFPPHYHLSPVIYLWPGYCTSHSQ